MSSIKIMADSTCDLSPELIEEYDITMIPLCILLGDKTYKDLIEITPDELYEWSDETQETPKTASPEIGTIIELLTPFVQEGKEIIFLGISEDMSTTCNSVRLAAKELEYDKITVIDSMNLSTGIGLLVLKAAALAKAGLPSKEVVKETEALRERVRASFVVDTLTYLHRGGRCSSVTALLANTLKLKPQIIVKNGKMEVGKKYRGNAKIAIKKYMQDLEPSLLKADPEMVFITHSGYDPEDLPSIENHLKKLNYFKHIYVTRAGGVISSHCGPNTLGILFFCAI